MNGDCRRKIHSDNQAKIFGKFTKKGKVKLLARYFAAVNGKYRVYPCVSGEVTPSECHANMSRLSKVDTLNRE